MNISEFRQAYPHYNDMTDSELSASLHAKHYSDMPKNEFDLMFIGRPNHDNIDTAAVSAADSLELQNISPEDKPVIVGTAKEILNLKRAGKIGTGKEIFQAPQGKVYVIDAKAVKEIYGASLAGSVKMAKMDILKGNDAHLLGYQQKGEADMVVNKQGDIISTIPEMVDEAKKGNIAYAASGNPDELAEKVGNISQAIRTNTPKKWKVIGGDSKNLVPSVLHEGRQLHGGSTHNDILDYHGMKREEGERGFTDPAGNFLTREQGKEYLAQYQPEIYAKVEGEELHSQPLNKAYNESQG